MDAGRRAAGLERDERHPESRTVQSPAHEDLDAFLTRHRRRVVANASRALRWPAAFFVVVATAIGVDLAAGVEAAVGTFHRSIELFALLGALVGMLGTALKLRSALRDGENLLAELEVTYLDLRYWRAEALEAGRGPPGGTGTPTNRGGKSSA